MSEIIVGLAVFISLLIAASFYRIFAGPTLYDRLLGVGAIGTHAVLLLALFGFMFSRLSGFLDLAITYAILNFVGVVAIAKFLDLDTADRREEAEAAAGMTAAVTPGESGPDGEKGP